MDTSASSQIAIGMSAFRRGDIAESVRHFDAARAQDPACETKLWQRGISLFYLGRFAEAAAQFRLDVHENPNDTEEAIWALLAEARAEGGSFAQAQRDMLHVGRDERVALRSAYAMFSGDREGERVLVRAADNETAVEATSSSGQSSCGRDGGAAHDAFYARFYLALFREAVGSDAAAKSELARALQSPYAAAALREGDVGDYMVAVALVHGEVRGWWPRTAYVAPSTLSPFPPPPPRRPAAKRAVKKSGRTIHACAYCDIVCTGKRQLREHCKGRKHLDRVAELGPLSDPANSVADDDEVNAAPPAPIAILSDDGDVLVVSKPAGLLVHRTSIAAGETDSLIDRLTAQLTLSGTLPEGASVRAAHRLDRATSGAMVLSRSAAGVRALCAAFAARQPRKWYVCVVRGWMPAPGRGRIETPLKVFDLANDRRKREKRRAEKTCKGGGHLGDSDVLGESSEQQHSSPPAPPTVTKQDASTEWIELARVEVPWRVGSQRSAHATSRYSLVAASPRTGRTHQIRRHLRKIDHPIVGDTQYGDLRHNRAFKSRLDSHRLLLHARSLRFVSPSTNEQCVATAPIPPEMLRLFEQFGWPHTEWEFDAAFGAQLSVGPPLSFPIATSSTLGTDADAFARWFDLLENVYAPLGIPKSYFRRHWTSDVASSRDKSMIFTMHHLDGGMPDVRSTSTAAAPVATVRVFRRTLRTAANGAVIVGGVGEVATLVACRRRGYATQLLRVAMEAMKDAGITYAALHAASSAAGLYRSLGFVAVPMPICLIEVPSNIPGSDGGDSVMMFDFEDDAAWSTTLDRIMPLQRAFAAQLDAFARTREYWECWVRRPAEALDSAGDATPGIMIGLELLRCSATERFTSAYLIAKAGGSFSGAVESSDGGNGSTGSSTTLDDARIVLLDFASRAAAGSPESEADLMTLLSAARAHLFGAGAGARAAGATPVGAARCGSLSLPVPRVRAAVPLRLALRAGDTAPRDTAQGEWMYADLTNAALPLVVRAHEHVVLPIDEF